MIHSRDEVAAHYPILDFEARAANTIAVEDVDDNSLDRTGIEEARQAAEHANEHRLEERETRRQLRGC